MSLSLPCRYAFFFSGSTPVRISSSSLCFSVVSLRTSNRNTKPSIRHVIASPRSNLEIVRARASSPLGSSSYDEETDSDGGGFDFSGFVSLAEAVCILSSAAVSVVLAANYAAAGEIGKKVLSLGFVGLLCSVASGSWLRRRQWMRICKGARGEGDGGRDLIRRLEKLEEDLKTSTNVVRVLSRHLEKLGIRFRVTRKALKEPVSEVKLRFFGYLEDRL